jgi:hypothetical protein
VEVIPDAVDYYPTAPVRVPLTAGEPLRVLWFGSISNVALFERYVPALTSLPGVEPVVATDANAVAAYSAKYPGVCFVPWSRSTFLATLHSCHLSCLMHDGTEVDRVKSNNRMITSITWGVPAVVSRTVEYERTAREAGVAGAVFGGPEDLRAVVESLRSVQGRDEYLTRAQPYVWQMYAPGAVARCFVRLVSDLLARPQQPSLLQRLRHAFSSGKRLSS